MKPIAYYNENDPGAAAWLRELIKAGAIAPGDVDERSIADVRGGDFTGYIQCHFFAGIGGWSHALRLAGWPDDRSVWTGSCPCQPFSNAGQHKGEADARHLWPELRRLIAECSPSVCFGEQVASAAGRIWLDGVRADLEGMGYAIGAGDLCAACVGAPHIRQRLFWMADARHLPQSERPRPARREAGERLAVWRIPASNRTPDRMADAERDGRWRDESQRGSQGRTADQRVAEGLHARGLVNADLSGCGEQSRPVAVAPEHVAAERPGRGFWNRFDTVHCADGKTRRIEPGSFPLAYGVPARVVRLRGYGNAIVPELAAEFIAACREVMEA